MGCKISTISNQTSQEIHTEADIRACNRAFQYKTEKLHNFYAEYISTFLLVPEPNSRPCSSISRSTSSQTLSLRTHHLSLPPAFHCWQNPSVFCSIGLLVFLVPFGLPSRILDSDLTYTGHWRAFVYFLPLHIFFFCFLIMCARLAYHTVRFNSLIVSNSITVCIELLA